MKIAIEGCAHGELEKIYESIATIENKDNIKIDLLICCGDFQSTRNFADLRCMAVPIKFQHICTFYKYYSGEKIAPILTIFIGGNHEASNFLQELPYGGWVAPNIYYLGNAGIVNVGGIRIGGISGIYKGHDYLKGHFEKPPYTEETKRSVYHIRNLEVFRLKQIKQSIDIFLSHDWPRGIYKYGNTEQLIRKKPFFRDEINNNSLGSKPCEDLLYHLKPTYWFSAHLHCKFAALIKHQDDKKKTKFLALDKCLPKRSFLQIIDFPNKNTKEIKLEYDLEWLTIVHSTNHLLSIKKGNTYMPGPNGSERWEFSPSQDDMDFIAQRLENNLEIPLNFTPTATSHSSDSQNNFIQQPIVQINPQTTTFCEKLGVDDPMALLMKSDNNVNHNISEASNCSLPSFLTPEKQDNITHTSFNNESDIEYENSFDQPESPLNSNSNSEIEPFSVKRISLSLPEPIFSANDYSDKIKPEDKLINSPEQEVSQNLFKDDDSEHETNLTVDYEKRELNTKMKKVKRRNQSIYSSTEDEY